jgi:uncharacterized membrane protein
VTKVHEACPACGHTLSSYRETDASSGERLATAVADRVATWWFSVVVIAFLAIWVGANMIWRPFEPYPVVVLAVISAVLACVTALQGPLILMTQRRAAERDRMRDREQLRVATNAEADIHQLDAKLDEIAAAIEALHQVPGT